ncbi:MAG: Ig domain-containing protein [Acidobacteriota bacterium]
MTATDASGCTGGRQYSVVINCATITVSPSSLPAGTVGTPTARRSRRRAARRLHVRGHRQSLPPGLALSRATGVISGTPTTSGTFNFTITATDAASCTGSRAYALVINPSRCGTILSPPTLPNGTVGVPYSQTVTASGGTAPSPMRSPPERSRRASRSTEPPG